MTETTADWANKRTADQAHNDSAGDLLEKEAIHRGYHSVRESCAAIYYEYQTDLLNKLNTTEDHAWNNTQMPEWPHDVQLTEKVTTLWNNARTVTENLNAISRQIEDNNSDLAEKQKQLTACTTSSSESAVIADHSGRLVKWLRSTVSSALFSMARDGEAESDFDGERRVAHSACFPR